MSFCWFRVSRLFSLICHACITTSTQASISDWSINDQIRCYADSVGSTKQSEEAWLVKLDNSKLSLWWSYDNKKGGITRTIDHRINLDWWIFRFQLLTSFAVVEFNIRKFWRMGENILRRSLSFWWAAKSLITRLYINKFQPINDWISHAHLSITFPFKLPKWLQGKISNKLVLSK